ncbi:MAG: hypothetical protein HC919_12525 [Oscillatoriales cyanobacterium SM2_2_1]|nr:hypothetical protein [Oscillatoriales cyanobacterium SM2_2_1]
MILKILLNDMERTADRSVNVVVDVVVTVHEVNALHGTGIIVQRMFPEDREIISIRSDDGYGGVQSFGRWQLCIKHDAAETAEERVQRAIAQLGEPMTVRRILCIPYGDDDLLTAIALHELYGAPLCLFVMDDRNLLEMGITTAILQRALAIARLRLTISLEMRNLYGLKFGLPFYVMPPIACDSLVPSEIPVPSPEQTPEVGIMIGNVWSQRAMERLALLTQASQVPLHWYGSSKSKAVPGRLEHPESHGITEFGFLPTEQEVAEKLRHYYFAVVPSGTLDLEDDRAELSLLSLPSRIPFIMSVSHTPILVLGSPNTAAAHFVTSLGIGLSCPYEPGPYRQTVQYLQQSEVQQSMRRKASQVTASFLGASSGEWLWQSLTLGKPVDDRYEKLFADPRLGIDSSLKYLLGSMAEMKKAHVLVPQLQERIAAMKTSKFWQLRAQWFRFKRLFGLGEDE